MPRFAILQHDFPRVHWDFLLEAGDHLRSWRLDEQPALGQAIRAEAIANHRPLYLDFEGPLSGGRGSVCRLDGGSYSQVCFEDLHVIVVLEGTRFQGLVTLELIAAPEWRFTLTHSNTQSPA